MVRFIGLLTSLLFAIGLNGQPVKELSLQEAYLLLEERYPALKNSSLLDQIHEKELAQIEKNSLPDIFLKADGRFQSESTSLDTDSSTPLPFEIDQPLFSVKTYLEANYLIMDGGLKEAQKSLKTIQLKADQQNLEVDRFALRERVNQHAVNIQLLRSQLQLFDISLADLQARRENVSASVANGVLLESELVKLDIKQKEIEAQKSNVVFSLTGMIKSLGDLLDINLAEDVLLQFPELLDPKAVPALNRPEQQYFKLQRDAILANSQIIEAGNRPKLSAFAQAGVGYPNPVNILDNNLALYGIIGAQFSWQITDWKKEALDKELLTLQAIKLKNTEDTFEFNINSKKASYLSDIDRIREQIKADEEIAALQAALLVQLAAQVDEGVITTTDYIIQVNAELKARQQLLVHQTELLNKQLLFWNEMGGF